MRRFLFWMTVSVLMFIQSNYVNVEAITLRDLVDALVQNTARHGNSANSLNKFELYYVLNSMLMYHIPDVSNEELRARFAAYQNPHELVAAALPAKMKRKDKGLDPSLQKVLALAQESLKNLQENIFKLNNLLVAIYAQIIRIKEIDLPFGNVFHTSELNENHLMHFLSFQKQKKELQIFHYTQFEIVMSITDSARVRYENARAAVVRHCRYMQSVQNEIQNDHVLSLHNYLDVLEKSTHSIIGRLVELDRTQKKIIDQWTTFGGILIGTGEMTNTALITFDQSRFVKGDDFELVLANPNFNTLMANFAYNAATYKSAIPFRSQSMLFSKGTFQQKIISWYYYVLIPAFGYTVPISYDCYRALSKKYPTVINSRIHEMFDSRSDRRPSSLQKIRNIMLSLQGNLSIIEGRASCIAYNMKQIRDGTLISGDDYNQCITGHFDKEKAEKFANSAKAVKAEIEPLMKQLEIGVSNICAVNVAGFETDWNALVAYKEASDQNLSSDKLRQPDDILTSLQTNVTNILKIIESTPASVEESLSKILKIRHDFWALLLGKTGPQLGMTGGKRKIRKFFCLS